MKRDSQKGKSKIKNCYERCIITLIGTDLSIKSDKIRFSISTLFLPIVRRDLSFLPSPQGTIQTSSISSKLLYISALIYKNYIRIKGKFLLEYGRLLGDQNFLLI